MSPRDVFALSNYLSADLKDRTISDARHTVSLTDFLQQTCLIGRSDDLVGRSVLLAVSDQLISAIAMMELDGLAGRMLVCPPDLNVDHVRTLIEQADVDAVVTDQPPRWSSMGVYQVAATRLPVWAPARARARRTTEWLTLTSDMLDEPKIVGHTSEDLCSAIAGGTAQGLRPVWATFSDIRRAGGLQILLRAVIGGGSTCAVRARRTDRGPCGAARRAQRDPHFRNAFAVACAPDEWCGGQLLAAPGLPARGDQRSGSAGWDEAGLSPCLHRSRQCRDRDRHRLHMADDVADDESPGVTSDSLTIETRTSGRSGAALPWTRQRSRDARIVSADELCHDGRCAVRRSPLRERPPAPAEVSRAVPQYLPAP